MTNNIAIEHKQVDWSNERGWKIKELQYILFILLLIYMRDRQIIGLDTFYNANAKVNYKHNFPEVFKFNLQFSLYVCWRKNTIFISNKISIRIFF